jgi:erythromycin esterase-like protein
VGPGNREVAEFVDWMRGYNAGLPADERASFHGLDLYNMRGSIAAVLAYLDRTDPQAAAVARRRYGCLTPWGDEPSDYGRAVLAEGYRKCEEAVVAQCRELLQTQLDAADRQPGERLDAAQNARLVASAERYYRIMYNGGVEAWHLRDTHMFETLRQLREAGGDSARAVVWAHNSHISASRPR